MTTYTAVFGSETIPPSQNGYAAIALTADTTYYWPELASSANLMADIMEVTPDAAWTMTFPAANAVSTGRDVLIRNLGAFTITLNDSAGGTIGTVAAGAAKYIYITNNSTAAGAWTIFTFGTGTSAADAATLAGYGLLATGATLSQQHQVVSSSVTATVATTNRAETFVFTNSGVVTCNLPAAATAGNGFFVNISNQGSGTVTLDPNGAETIDGEVTKDLAPGESLTAVCSGVLWASVGYGRSTQFQFTKLVLDISVGSPFTLTSVQAQNKLIQTIGTITGNVTVNVPAVVAIYYIECSHSGAFTTTFKTAAGAGIALSAGDRSILYCDGVDVVQAQTATAPAANLSGGVAGAVVYQTGVGTTGYTAAGTTGQILISGGTGSPTWSDGGAITAGYSSKATPVDADSFMASDSAAANGPIHVTWANIKAAGKAYFDTLYAKIGLVTGSGATMSTARLLGRTTAATGTVEEISVGTGLSLSAGTLSASASNSTEESLTGFYYPAAGSAFQDMYRSGWLPSWFNQQWGGAQWGGSKPDGSTPTTAEGAISFATGNVEDNDTAFTGFGSAAGDLFASEGFQVSESITTPIVWVKLYKFGNPTDNLSVAIYSDSAGAPNAVVCAAVTKSSKEITSKTDGEWYSFAVGAGTLTANTQYHIVMTRSGSVDVSNYYKGKSSTPKKYPFGYLRYGGTSATATAKTTHAFCFLIQNPAANSLIQSSGMFDHKLAFNPGTPTNQSRSVAQPLSNFYDGKTCSVLYRGTYAVSTNVWDFCYGLDHDRITLTINASGYPVLTIYESDRTVTTVTGTGSVASGNHDVGIRVRTVGDGADYATLYVDGVSVGTPLTAQTFTMDVNMVTLGTARLGDGFGLAPTWTQDMQMTSLPSAQGWTWTGTATEANAMSVSGGKLYQNANGYTSTQSGYYTKTTAFVNATGWTASFKVRVSNDPNTRNEAPINLQVIDGTKVFNIYLKEYYIDLGSSLGGGSIQIDLKSQENVITVQGKGSDAYIFVNGKLVWDGTGLFTDANSTNRIVIGDNSATASQNADAIWSYVKYYQGGMVLPTAGANTCSEFAHWSGDKSALFPSLWNSGTPVSVKQLCGVPRNYQFEQVVQKEVRRGVTGQVSTGSTTPTLIADMESYVMGSQLNHSQSVQLSNTAIGKRLYEVLRLDGVNAQETYSNSAVAGYAHSISQSGAKQLTLGLHKVEGCFYTDANTLSTEGGNSRNLTVEARS